MVGLSEVDENTTRRDERDPGGAPSGIGGRAAANTNNSCKGLLGRRISKKLFVRFRSRKKPAPFASPRMCLAAARLLVDFAVQEFAAFSALKEPNTLLLDPNWYETDASPIWRSVPSLTQDV